MFGKTKHDLINVCRKCDLEGVDEMTQDETHYDAQSAGKDRSWPDFSLSGCLHDIYRRRRRRRGNTYNFQNGQMAELKDFEPYPEDVVVPGQLRSVPQTIST